MQDLQEFVKYFTIWMLGLRTVQSTATNSNVNQIFSQKTNISLIIHAVCPAEHGLPIHDELNGMTPKLRFFRLLNSELSS
jgi:hypothetical protein